MTEQPAQGDQIPAEARPADARPDVTRDAAEAADAAPAAEPRQVTLRRAPRYRAFVITGVLVGLVLALVLVRIFPDDSQYSTSTVLSYLAATLGLAGGLLGAGLALLVERPRR